MKILANDFRQQWLETRRDTLDAVERVGAEGWYVLGSEVETFENELANLWGVSSAIGVASGLDAIEISLRALGCERGHKVLTSPISAFATTLAILKLGAIPVFCDVDAFGLIDLDNCEETLRGDPAIRFFVPVHLYGHSLNLNRLERIRNEFQLSLVEDCAQSILAKHCGRHTGTVGQLAATSFYPTKNLGALGDGGAILTNLDPLSKVVRTLRDYGQNGKYQHETIGYNSRLDELQAAILGRAHLPRLQSWTARRKEIANAYTRGIHHIGIDVPGAPEGSDSCWHLYPVFVSPDRKSNFVDYMRTRGVAVGEHYPTPIFEQAAMRSVKHQIVGSVSRSRSLCSSEVSLPIHPYLKDAEVEAVIESCNTWSG
jgi:dTDP-4-amino-4,6-dideoxygalactose transaminase